MLLETNYSLTGSLIFIETCKIYISMRVLTIKQLNYAEKLSFWNHEYFQNQKTLLFDTEQLNSEMVFNTFENLNKREF